MLSMSLHGKFRFFCKSYCIFSTLTSPILGEDRIKPGDEVISVAAGFPTTVNPILQNNCVPVFVDVDIATLNVDITQLSSAITPRTNVDIFGSYSWEILLTCQRFVLCVINITFGSSRTVVMR